LVGLSSCNIPLFDKPKPKKIKEKKKPKNFPPGSKTMSSPKTSYPQKITLMPSVPNTYLVENLRLKMGEMYLRKNKLQQAFQQSKAIMMRSGTNTWH
jgi:hypothetical protein